MHQLPLSSSRNTESVAECTTLCPRGRSLLRFLSACLEQIFGNEISTTFVPWLQKKNKQLSVTSDLLCRNERKF